MFSSLKSKNGKMIAVFGILIGMLIVAFVPQVGEFLQGLKSKLIPSKS